MEALKSLLSVKKIIAIILTGVFSVLSLKGIVSGENFLVVFTTIISFYYGASSTRQAIAENTTTPVDTTTTGTTSETEE